MIHELERLVFDSLTNPAHLVPRYTTNTRPARGSNIYK
jgi:hypothetical protein